MNSKPSSQKVWARLIPQNADKEDLHFSTNDNQTNEYKSPTKWKIYQDPQGPTTKIINQSDSHQVQVNGYLLEKNQEFVLSCGDIISWNEQENGNFFDYVFVLMKSEPKNELKRDRSEDSSHTIKLEERFSDSKSVKVEDNSLFQQTFESFLSSLTDDEEDQGVKAKEYGTTWEENGVYEGSFVNGKKHGEGKMTYKDGAIYEGSWKDGKREGEGKLTLPNGDIYRATWISDIIQSPVTIHQGNGKEYEGEVDQTNLTKHGKGVLTRKDDVKIEGNWVNGVIEPQVTIHYFFGGEYDNARYEGPIDPKTLDRNGKGVLIYKNGDSYEGSFIDEYFNGQGVYKWKDGDIYEGEFKNGERNGWGIMKYANGNKLECNWKKGKSEGKGKVLLANGGVLEGKWVKDNLKTPVVISYRNGDQYKGAVCQETFKRDGKGALSYKNGDVYDGYWKNGKKNGRGSFKYGDRLELIGEWRNGENVGKGKFISGDLVLEGKWQKQ